MSAAPAIITRNSGSPVSDRIVVYWASPKGELQLAPDTRITQAQLSRMKEYRHWKRCEAVGAKEIEKISLIISRQEFERKKQMKVQQTLREMEFLKEAEMLAKIRKAQNYSAADVKANADREKFWALRQRAALAVVASEFDPSKRNTALEIELRPRSTSPSARIGQKREGIQ